MMDFLFNAFEAVLTVMVAWPPWAIAVGIIAGLAGGDGEMIAMAVVICIALMIVGAFGLWVIGSPIPMLT